MTDLNFQQMPPYNTKDIEERIRKQSLSLRTIFSDTFAADAFAFKEILMKDKEWVKYYHGIISDKWLEHFLSVYFLKPQMGEVMVDVASHWSPFYKIVEKVSNVKIYLQDICFEPGIHDNRIGSECISIPLPDSSVDIIAVNNSLEHFEQGKDTLFLKEAYRLLKPGGRMCIVPLFLNSVLVNMADPDVDLSSVVFDPGAVIVKGSPWKIRFARFYTPELFMRRLVHEVPKLKYEIISIQNMNSFDPLLNYWQFVAYVRKDSH